MWMSEESSSGFPMPGRIQLTGTIDYLERQPMTSSGIGGQPREVLLFRLKTSDGKIVNCRFDGTRSGPLDLGDDVQVSGWSFGGSIEVSSIIDRSSNTTIARSGFGFCFIATVAYGHPEAPEVEQLRAFRDEVLRRYVAGRAFIAVYARVGPWLARCIAPSPRLRAAIRRWILTPVCRFLPSASQRPKTKDGDTIRGADGGRRDRL